MLNNSINYFFLKIAKNEETALMILVLSFMANDFSAAFPPMVRAEIMAETNTVTNRILALVLFVIMVTMTVPHAPETMPQTSPITSQQIDDTLEAFLTSKTPILPLFIFRALIELNTVISPLVTATPIVSKTIPIMINVNVIKIAINNGTLFNAIVENSDITTEIQKAVSVTIISQRF